MSRIDEMDQEDQDQFDRYGYPDLPWMVAEQEWRDEQDAFERFSRYYDAPVEPQVPFRASEETDLVALQEDLELMAAGMALPSIRTDLRDAA